MDSRLLASAKLLRANVALLQRNINVPISTSNQTIKYQNGICYNLNFILLGLYHRELTPTELTKIEVISQNWSEYSGNPDYPITGTRSGDSCIGHPENNHWIEKHGLSRIRLLDLIIDKLNRGKQ